MAIDVRWLLDHKIIQVHITNDISLDDITHLSTSILTLFEQSDAALIHIIVNKDGSGKLPKSLNSVIEATKFLRHAQLGWFIIYGQVGHGNLAVFFSTVVTGLAQVRHRRFETIEDCIAFLTSVDSSLTSLEELLNKYDVLYGQT
jgi:hypothetical protein